MPAPARWQAGPMGTGEDTVVVIEDDHHISDLVAMYLRRDGFRVLQADDGEAGLDLVDREHPSWSSWTSGSPVSSTDSTSAAVSATGPDHHR